MKYHPRRELKKHLQIPTFNPLSQPESDILPPLSASQVMHLLGKYGPDVPRMFESTSPQDWETVGGSQTLWAELRWAARREAVVHLDDLLLRRVRVGLTLPKGGSEHFERLQRLVQAELGWDEAHWHREVEAYLQRWQTAYSLPIAKN
jgi:glycerol-3-phosphate dehydrogenase